MDKIKINTQSLGGISNIKPSDEVNKTQPIILTEESSISEVSEVDNDISGSLTEESIDDKSNKIEDNTNKNNIQEQNGEDIIIPRTHVTIKKEEIKNPTNLVVEKKDELVGKKTDKDLFVNYDSDFHKNEKTIMQRIRLFKMTPRTRTGFVVSSIFITVFIIALMMKLDPENQSLSNYKASILSIIGPRNNQKVVDTGIVNTPPQDLNNNIGIIETPTQTGITNTGIVENNTQTGVINTGATEEDNLIKEKWLTIKPDIIVKEDGSTEYIHKGQSFSKEGLQEELKKEVKAEIDKKIKDYLNKIYIENK